MKTDAPGVGFTDSFLNVTPCRAVIVTAEWRVTAAEKQAVRICRVLNNSVAATHDSCRARRDPAWQCAGQRHRHTRKSVAAARAATCKFKKIRRPDIAVGEQLHRGQIASRRVGQSVEIILIK